MFQKGDIVACRLFIGGTVIFECEDIIQEGKTIRVIAVPGSVVSYYDGGSSTGIIGPMLYRGSMYIFKYEDCRRANAWEIGIYQKMNYLV